MPYNKRNQPPRWIKARFKSICPETGKTINEGDECIYYPSLKKTYHIESRTAIEWKQQQQSDSFGLGDANW